MSEHTLGPWTASDDLRGVWDIIHDGDLIAQVWRVRPGIGDDLPAEANARLIAAAPKMFAALKMVEDDPGLTSSANMVVKSALSEALTGKGE